MDEVTLLVSGFVEKDKRKIVRVSFLRGQDYAEGILPDGVIDKSKGYDAEEIQKLEKFLRLHKDDIMQQAKQVNPIRSWLQDK